MKTKSFPFYLGVFSSVILAASFLDISSLQAVSSRLSLARLPSEIRLAAEVGLITLDEAFSRKINRSITRKEFGLILRKSMHLLGQPSGGSLRELKDSGIFNSSPAHKRMTRKDALEAMCRVIIALESQGKISFFDLKKQEFSDYSAPAKYEKSIAFLKGNQVARGIGRNCFGVGKSLRKRDAIFFIFRLYEKISSVIGNKNSGGELAFVDLAQDHPVMRCLRDLDHAGAFDLVVLRPSFDGNRLIRLSELSAICQGIIDKSGIRCLLEFEANQVEKMQPATRVQMARILEKISDLGNIRNEMPVGRRVQYVDIPVSSPDSQVLNRLGSLGIVLGYPDRRLAPDEPVTWFESVGTLHALMRSVKFSSMADPVVDERPNRPLVKRDIEEFIELIKAKRARIRTILRADTSRPGYSRD